MRENLTHIGETGEVRMVDVGDKTVTHREALAEGSVRMQAETLAMVLSGGLLAVGVYHWLGLKFLSQGWFNLDLVWALRLAMVLSGNAKKGDVLSVARIAGIMAAKRTSELIPLCHPLALTKVEVTIEADEALPGLKVRALARVTGQTGVEMEALTAASVACLTIYDMAKAVDRGMEIIRVRLLTKSGGKSGDWSAAE